MKTNSFDKEIENYYTDKKEIDNIINNSIVFYAEYFKKNRENILKHLSNPQLNHSIKYKKKHMFKTWWNNMRKKINNYFFN